MGGANIEVFRAPEVVESFVHNEGWLEDGERVALLSVASQVRGQPVLDIGVGVGRTSSLFRMLTDSYVALDYSPEMVKRCSELHPNVDVRLGDAQDLSAFPDDSFELVFFSNYGVDALDIEGRRKYLAEARRVLRDGGLLVHNTMNKEGRLYGEKPWQLHAPGQPPDLSPRRIAGWCWHNLKDPMRAPRRYRNWLISRRSASDHEEWAAYPFSGHDFALVTCFVTLDYLRKELDDSGFSLLTIYSCPTGEVIDSGQKHTDVPGFYAIGKKRAQSTVSGATD